MAGKQLDIGGFGGGAAAAAADIQSHNYWNFNIIRLNDRVLTGFYDFYTKNKNKQRVKMPSLVHLKKRKKVNCDDEVILVNHRSDPELHDLINKAHQWNTCRLGTIDLIYKVACLVVDAMGGPVNDVCELEKLWATKICLLQDSLKTIVVPIGRLDVGLSRHRALLFKVLAGSLGIPSILVRADDEAVNLFRGPRGCYYIIHMMGDRVTFIPAEADVLNIPIKNFEKCTQLLFPPDIPIPNYHFTATDFIGIAIQQYNKLYPFEPQWQEFQWEDLDIIGECISSGSSYTKVYRSVDHLGKDVAVTKWLDQDVYVGALDLFESEIEIMHKLKHPNVVRFVGAITRPPHSSILTEFLPRGSLYRLLHCSDIFLPAEKRLRMALDVAKGMNYLHTRDPPIVHRDLNTKNLLVDKDWVVKVSDFGLSRMKYHACEYYDRKPEWIEWMAPEVLRKENANEKSDVYSFGVILWELTTMQIPWNDKDHEQIIQAVSIQNKRLEIPNTVDQTVAAIIRDCWEKMPERRPSFSNLIHRLRRLVSM